MTDRWSARLSEYLDGDVAERERREIERHLESCAQCRDTLASLTDLKARARELPPIAPATDLWPQIAARLPAARQPASRPGWLGRRLSLSLPQMAGLTVGLMVLSASIAWWMVGRAPWLVTREPSVAAGRPLAVGSGPAAPSPTQAPAIASASFVDARYDATIADLQRTLEQGRDRLDPKTIRVLEKNLAIIDRAVTDARRAVDADPSSLYLREHLASMMMQKVDLLRQAAVLASQG
jgi:hypothetical protein